MTEPGWQRLWDIFHEASARPDAERAAYLDAACGGDTALRAEIAELLAAHGATHVAVDRPPGLSRTGLGEGLGPDVGDVIDRYRLTRVLGEGGMGVVFEADQLRPVTRRVALKVVKPGMDSREVLRRFEGERQALALMNHGGIARVYDAGVTDQGRPFFVMEQVDGEPITRFADHRRLDVAARVQLMVQVCLAVQHAHQRGVIHRDLKPSNVLVQADGDTAQPKIIDFGIARALVHPLVDDSGRTRLGDLIGTPEYMSPEQAQAIGLDVDTRSDIYSLGVILYELLTGTLPLDATTLGIGGYMEWQRVLRDREPLAPSARYEDSGPLRDQLARERSTTPARLTSSLSGDLDSIVLKALAKDRAMRYDSVGDFAADLLRFSRGQPVLAHPPGRVYRLRKFVARHRLGVTAGAVAGLAVIAAVAGIIGGLVVATRERQRAETVNSFLEDMLVAPQPENARGRDTTYLQEVLARASQRVDGELEAQPVVAARLHDTIGQTYRALGLSGEAVTHLRRSFELQRDASGAADPRTLEALSSLAVALWEDGDYPQAEQLAREALAGQDLALDPADEARLSTLNTLALVTKSNGELAEAERLYREVVGLRRQTLGVEDPQTLTAISNLARLLEDRGQLEESETLMREVVSVGRKALGNDHPHTLVSIDILASILRRSGELREAEVLNREALEGSVKVMGPTHIDTLGARFNLARLLLDAGKPADAEQQLRAVLDALGPEQGKASFYVMSTSHYLGDSLFMQEKWDEAGAAYAQATSVGSQLLPGDHPSLATLEMKTARVLAKRGDFRQAQRLLEHAYPILESEAGPKGAATMLAVETMVSVLAALGRQDEAARWQSLLPSG
jgi:non-specific serine/threonine protein kinase/serine/threonine-protein kinase